MSSGVRELVRPGGPSLDALDRATERVLREHDGDSLVVLDDNALRGEVATIVDLVRDALAGRRPRAPAPEVLDRVRLLHSLRTALVTEWSEADGSILPAVKAIETVQRQLVDWVDDASVTDVLDPFAQGLVREVAHLLRSPLGSVVMLAAILGEERSGPLNDTQKRQLDIIYRAALGATSIAADLVTLIDGKRRNGAREPVGAREPFMVGEMIQMVADVARPVAEARGRDLIVRSAIDRMRFGPVSGLSKALLELVLRSALGARGGRVELSAEPSGAADVCFSISSSSCDRSTTNGTNGEIATDVFRVLRVDADSGVHALSTEGLGLSAARGILRRLGSDLRVDANGNGEMRITARVSLPPAE